MNFLVTGGAGFIGSHVCERLLRDWHSVWIYDDLNPFYDPKLKEANLGEIETQFRVDNDMCKTDVDYFHELLHEIPKCLNQLDDTYRGLLDREIKDLDRVELAILRIGTYELSKRIDVPFKVAINEGIELAKYFGATESHKYVNGVLDKVAQRLRVAEMKANPPTDD